jgi:hypothetical protein
MCHCATSGVRVPQACFIREGTVADSLGRCMRAAPAWAALDLAAVYRPGIDEEKKNPA